MIQFKVGDVVSFFARYPHDPRRIGTVVWASHEHLSESQRRRAFDTIPGGVRLDYWTAKQPSRGYIVRVDRPSGTPEFFMPKAANMSHNSVPEELVEVAARAAHEVIRVWCSAHGDESQVPWEAAPEWQKDSARRGIPVALGGASPEEQHKAWMAAKRASGWTFGPVKDEVKKTHPCLVDYKHLPPIQQAKDTLYAQVVRAVATAWFLSSPASKP